MIKTNEIQQSIKNGVLVETLDKRVGVVSRIDIDLFGNKIISLNGFIGYFTENEIKIFGDKMKICPMCLMPAIEESNCYMHKTYLFKFECGSIFTSSIKQSKACKRIQDLILIK